MRQSIGPSRWLLLACLGVSTVVAAQSTSPIGDLPPPGTMSAQMPEGMQLYIGLAVSDATQQVVTAIGSTETEARLRAKKDCNAKGGNCGELATFPVRNHCMAVAADRGAKPNVRAIFVSSGEAGKAKPGQLAKKAMSDCAASGAKQCELQNDYCF
jgi:hypothetical protein